MRPSYWKIGPSKTCGVGVYVFGPYNQSPEGLWDGLYENETETVYCQGKAIFFYYSVIDKLLLKCNEGVPFPIKCQTNKSPTPSMHANSEDSDKHKNVCLYF